MARSGMCHHDRHGAVDSEGMAGRYGSRIHDRHKAKESERATNRKTSLLEAIVYRRTGAGCNYPYEGCARLHWGGRVTSVPGPRVSRRLATTGRSHLLHVPLHGNMPGRSLGTDSASGRNSAESFGVKEGLPLGDALGDGDWWRRAASTALSEPSAVIKFFFRQWHTTDETLRTGSGQCSLCGWRWGTPTPMFGSTVLHEGRSSKGWLKNRLGDASTKTC